MLFNAVLPQEENTFVTNCMVTRLESDLSKKSLMRVTNEDKEVGG